MIVHKNLHFLFLLVCGLISIGRAEPLLALHLGLAAVEAGDDRVRPASQLQLNFTENWASQTTLYGRKYGVVVERTLIQSILYASTPSPSFVDLRLNIGPAILWDSTSLEISPGEELTENRFNFGLTLGVLTSWELGTFKMYAFAHSHLFPAGQAALLLVTGRRQTIGIGIGF